MENPCSTHRAPRIPRPALRTHHTHMRTQPRALRKEGGHQCADPIQHQGKEVIDRLAPAHRWDECALAPERAREALWQSWAGEGDARAGPLYLRSPARRDTQRECVSETAGEKAMDGPPLQRIIGVEHRGNCLQPCSGRFRYHVRRVRPGSSASSGVNGFCLECRGAVERR